MYVLYKDGTNERHTTKSGQSEFDTIITASVVLGNEKWQHHPAMGKDDIAAWKNKKGRVIVLRRVEA